MTDDEILYAMNEGAAAFEANRVALERRFKGRLVNYYGNRKFRVDNVKAEVVNWRAHDGWAYVTLHGPLLKKDGTPHNKNKGSMKLEDAKFV